MFGRPAPRIEFLCAPENLGVIAEPVPARDALPDWFRRLPAVDKERLSVTDNALTVKRCMPFLDAMNAGWVLPLAATVRIEIADGGQTVNSGWDFDRTMVSQHHPYQVAGHPMSPRPPGKFHNHWAIRTPPGWSCLFVPPLNRPNGVVEVAAGVVDTDTYHALIHFPFFAIGSDGLQGQDLLSYEIFVRELELEIEAERFPDWMQPLNQFYNVTGLLAQLGSGTSAQPFQTVADYDAWLKRASQVPTLMASMQANMREGMAAGVVQPKVLMLKVVPQLDALIKDAPEETLFWRPIAEMPADFSAEDKARLTESFRGLIADQLMPAYRDLRRFVNEEYLPASRDTVSLAALPDGEAWYAYRAKRSTTTGALWM